MSDKFRYTEDMNICAERTAEGEEIKVSLEVQIGQNATPTTGDPEYTGEFYLQSYTPTIETGGAVTFAAVLQPAEGTAPAWGTVS